MSKNNENYLKKAAQALGKWQKLIITKHKTDDGKEEIPHPAAAPMSTDQEAGGATTSPDSKYRRDDNNRAKTPRIHNNKNSE